MMPALHLLGRVCALQCAEGFDSAVSRQATTQRAQSYHVREVPLASFNAWTKTLSKLAESFGGPTVRSFDLDSPQAWSIRVKSSEMKGFCAKLLPTLEPLARQRP